MDCPLSAQVEALRPAMNRLTSGKPRTPVEVLMIRDALEGLSPDNRVGYLLAELGGALPADEMTELGNRLGRAADHAERIIGGTQ